MKPCIQSAGTFIGGYMTLLKSIIVAGGTTIIIKEVADRLKHAGVYHEQAVRRGKRGMLALGIAVGCTMGIATGILYAPKPGRETRENLRRRTGEVWEDLKENVSDTGHRLTAAAEEKGSRVRTAAQKRFEATRNATKEALEETGKKK